MLKVTLTIEKKYRNKHEWRPVNVATLEVNGQVFQSKGDGFNIEKVCKKALDSNPDLEASPVEVYRGSQKVYNTFNLGFYATGNHYKSVGEQPEQLRKSKTGDS